MKKTLLIFFLIFTHSCGLQTNDTIPSEASASPVEPPEDTADLPEIESLEVTFHPNGNGNSIPTGSAVDGGSDSSIALENPSYSVDLGNLLDSQDNLLVNSADEMTIRIEDHDGNLLFEGSFLVGDDLTSSPASVNPASTLDWDTEIAPYIVDPSVIIDPTGTSFEFDKFSWADGEGFRGSFAVDLNWIFSTTSTGENLSSSDYTVSMPRRTFMLFDNNTTSTSVDSTTHSFTLEDGTVLNNLTTFASNTNFTPISYIEWVSDNTNAVLIETAPACGSPSFTTRLYGGSTGTRNQDFEILEFKLTTETSPRISNILRNSPVSSNTFFDLSDDVIPELLTSIGADSPGRIFTNANVINGTSTSASAGEDYRAHLNYCDSGNPSPYNIIVIGEVYTHLLLEHRLDYIIFQHETTVGSRQIKVNLGEIVDARY